MTLDVVKLTKDLVNFNSVSQWSNVPVTRYIAKVLESLGFAIEELPYTDMNGVDKLSIVGKLGTGTGGLTLMSHDDVVPAANVADWTGDPFVARLSKGKLYGRGSADMKGPQGWVGHAHYVQGTGGAHQHIERRQCQSEDDPLPGRDEGHQRPRLDGQALPQRRI